VIVGVNRFAGGKIRPLMSAPDYSSSSADRLTAWCAVRAARQRGYRGATTEASGTLATAVACHSASDRAFT
jgi:hypothetical protein